MAGEGLFDPQLVIKEWFGSIDSKDWFDASLVSKPAGGATNYTLTCAAGSYAVTGQAATLKRNRSLSLAAGAYSYSGVSAGLKRNVKLICAAGSYLLTGNAATLTYTPGAVNYTLVCSAGSYSLTGQAATLTRGYALNVAAGAYVVAGNDAALTYTPGQVDYTLACDAGAYVVVGVSAELSYQSAQVVVSRRKHRSKAYLKRDNEILVFNDEDEKEQFLEAEKQAKQAINRAARRKIAKPNPVAVDLPKLEQQARHLEIENIQALMIQQDYQRILEIHLAIQQMLEDEDEEILLLL